MSDSFNQETHEDSFDADKFLRSLCQNTKVTIPNRANIAFLSGWKLIVETLINKIANYPVSIIRCDDFYSVLDIDFSVTKRTREVYVWRAINDARKQSQQTCAVCGAYKSLFRSTNSASMFCNECAKSAAEMGKTGTWLDSY